MKKGKISSRGLGRVWVALMRQTLPCLGWVSGVMVIEVGVMVGIWWQNQRGIECDMVRWGDFFGLIDVVGWGCF